MREQCDSSVGTRSTANVLHFRDAKRSRRRGCKMPVKGRASATVALRRRCGAGGRIRTADLFITSESLCLLSHTSLPCFRIIANPHGKINGFDTICDTNRHERSKRPTSSAFQDVVAHIGRVGHDAIGADGLEIFHVIGLVDGPELHRDVVFVGVLYEPGVAEE